MCAIIIKADTFISPVGKEQTLKDIVTDHAFPVDVKFAKDQEFDVGASTTSANRFPQLKLIDVFDEVYFLANTIIDGKVNIQSSPNSSNTDGSFIMANSNSFLSQLEILPIAQENNN